MALIIKDRVLETCSSPGTGSVTLLGAVSGYQTFNAAVGNGNTCYYTIADQTGNKWEVGVGTFTAPATLARTTILASYTGALVNFSTGSQNVFLTYPAEKAVTTDTFPSLLSTTLSSPPPIGDVAPNTGKFSALTVTGTTTLNTTITGLLKASSGVVSMADVGVDYAPPTSGASILYGNGFGGFSNVTVGSGLSFSAGILSNSAPSSIPSGTVTNFFQAAAPTGWVKSTSYNNYAMRIVSGTGGGTGGSVGFTTAFASQTPAGSVSLSGGTVSSTTLSTAEIPSHNHSTNNWNAYGGPDTGSNGYNNPVATTTGSTGGGGSHTHGFTPGTASFSGSAINLAVNYIDAIICTKS